MNPLIILNFECESGNFDINVSKDKKSVILQNENDIVHELKIKLHEFFEEIQRVKAYGSDNFNKVNYSITNSKKRPYSEITSNSVNGTDSNKPSPSK